MVFFAEFIKGINSAIPILDSGIVNFISNHLIMTFIGAVIGIFIWLALVRIDANDYNNAWHKEKVFDISIKDYVYIAWLAIGLALILNVLVGLVGLSKNDDLYKQVDVMINSQPFIIKLLAAGIVIPIQEELMFRSIILRRIEKAYGAGIAVIVSSLMFAVIHINITQMLYAFIMGIVIGYIYHKSNNIYTAIIFHISANSFALAISSNTASRFLEANTYVLPIILLVMLISSICILIYIVKEYKGVKI